MYFHQHSILYIVHIRYKSSAIVGPTCSLLSVSPTSSFDFYQDQFFLPCSDLLEYIWANVSPRPNANHILSLKQTKLLLTFLIHLKYIRNKCDAYEENVFFNILISYSRATEGWKHYLIFSFVFTCHSFG